MHILRRPVHIENKHRTSVAEKYIKIKGAETDIGRMLRELFECPH